MPAWRRPARKALVRRVASALAALSLAGACTSCQRQPSPPDILLLTLDTTRVDAIGAYGHAAAATPVLDAFALEALRFEGVVTTAPYTGPAHASMLTGLVPPRHGLRDFLGDALPEEVATLAEILKGSGYETAAFVSAYVLDPIYGLDQGFEIYRGAGQPKRGRSFAERGATATVNDALAWVETRDASRPLFLWLHLFDPHFPYRPPGAFKKQAPFLDAAARRRLRYYEEVTYMDSQIGRVLEHLDSDVPERDFVVLVVADHGEPLGERDTAVGAHSPNLMEATLRVPLLLRAPGLAAGVDDRQASVTDVFPTLLEFASVAVPPDIDGESLLSATRNTSRPVYSETLYERFPRRAEPGDELVAVDLDGWRLLSRPGRLELYDLRSDPEELHDLSSARQPELARLQAALANLRESFAARSKRSLVPEGEDVHLERLRSLGYVE